MTRDILRGPAGVLAAALLACGGAGESEPPFAVTAVAPARGTTLGGTPVVVSGRGFGAAATVKFDGVPATGISVVSATEIHCTTPPHASGLVAVTVENSASDAAFGPNAFTFDAPPTALAEHDWIVTPGATVALRGGGSTDPDSSGLVYAWFLVDPAGSTATLSDAAAAAPTFVADVPGTYVATLVVNDGVSDSPPSSVFVRTSETASRVPDTRLETCAGASPTVPCPHEGESYFGQDASYLLVPPKLTLSTDTVLDEVTGLTWERVDEGLYNWFEAAGRYDAVYNASGNDVCGSLVLGGFSDWRLPSAHELYTLASFSPDSGGLPDPTAFPGFGTSPYWTSTERCTDLYCPPAQIAFPRLSYGNGHRMDPMRVVCVRGPAWGVNAFVDQGDGTVRDDATGLVWERSPAVVARSWRNALAWCEALVLGGRDDWRLPSAKELQTLVAPMDLGPFPDTQAADYWSSTPLDGGAWTVDFGVELMDPLVLASTVFVRCVR